MSTTFSVNTHHLYVNTYLERDLSDSFISDRFSEQGDDADALPLFAGNRRESR